MFHIGHAGRLDAKVVGDKAKGDVMPHVMPKARCVLTLIIASDGKACFKGLFARMPVCGSLYIPLQILTYTHPVVSTILVGLYLSIISWGRISSHRRMYS